MSHRSSIVVRLGCAALFLSVAVGCGRASDDPTTEAPKSDATSQTRAATSSDILKIADDLPRLPNGITMGARPVGVLRATYEFAARHPEVISHIPCFCGCVRPGAHRSNHDCFIGARDASGKVTQWDSHAIGCEICIDVAEVAMQMHNSGASVTAIRAAVDKRYAGQAHGHAPTPTPSRGGETPK